jgi:glycosyltransferase involved in cell wall biosynthesis
MTYPLVSICCITYNHEKYIRDALEGFLVQKTNFSFEIIINDDASTDNTANIIREYEEKYPELFVCIYQKENQWSKGIRPSTTYVWPKARGKYIALCEGDDYWTDPYKLQKQVDFLETNPEYSLCFTDYSRVDSDNNLIRQNCLPKLKKDNFEIQDIVGGFWIPTLTITFRRKFLDFNELELFKEIYNGDLLLVTLLIIKGLAKFLKMNSANYRIHEQGVFSKKERKFKFETRLMTYKQMFRVFEKNKLVKKRLIKAMRNHMVALFFIYIKNSELKNALVHLKNIVLFDFKFRSTALIRVLILMLIKPFNLLRINLLAAY